MNAVHVWRREGDTEGQIFHGIPIVIDLDLNGSRLVERNRRHCSREGTEGHRHDRVGRCHRGLENVDVVDVAPAIGLRVDEDRAISVVRGLTQHGDGACHENEQAAQFQRCPPQTRLPWGRTHVMLSFD